MLLAAYNLSLTSFRISCHSQCVKKLAAFTKEYGTFPTLQIVALHFVELSDRSLFHIGVVYIIISVVYTNLRSMLLESIGEEVDPIILTNRGSYAYFVCKTFLANP